MPSASPGPGGMRFGGMRFHARQLGLRHDTNNAGRLNFPSGSPAKAMWINIVKLTLPRAGTAASLADVNAVIEAWGPKVWGRGTGPNLFRPGEHPEYPEALRWPEDRQRILDIFKAIYTRRSVQSQKLLKHKRSFDSAESSGDSESDVDDISQRLKIGEQFEAKDLFLTNIWAVSSDYKLTAAVRLGTIRTLRRLFQECCQAFQKANPKEWRKRGENERNPLSLTLIPPMNLGENFRKHITFTRESSDLDIRDFRSNLTMAHQKHRHVDEEVKFYATMSFGAG